MVEVLDPPVVDQTEAPDFPKCIVSSSGVFYSPLMFEEEFFHLFFPPEIIAIGKKYGIHPNVIDGHWKALGKNLETLQGFADLKVKHGDWALATPEAAQKP